MGKGDLGTVVRHLRQVIETPAAKGLSDSQLLDRFLRTRDETAFAVLVQRHGAMVLNVCRQVLRHEQDAEDAFQAAFLVLARKAGSIRKTTSLASWLYAVAYRTSRRAWTMSSRQRRQARQAKVSDVSSPSAEAVWREVQALVAEEVQRLPEKYRAPFVLCCLHGLSKPEAAQQLGWKEGTVSGRLAQARRLLQQRLARRGVELTAVLAIGAVGESSASAVSLPLVQATIEAAMQLNVRKALTAGIASAEVVALTRSVLRSMALSRVKLGLVVLVLGMLGGSGIYAQQRASAPAKGRDGRAEAVPSPLLLATEQEKSVQSAAEPKLPPGDRMRVSGRVVDENGKPVADAQVAIVARPQRGFDAGNYDEHREVLGLTRTAADGAFRVETPRTSSEHYQEIVALARGGGLGLGWETLNPDAAHPDVSVKLPREQVIRGHLVTLEGLPAAGVKVDVLGIGPHFWPTGERTALWPEPAITDARGNFVVRGIGAKKGASLRVLDDRFVQHHLYVQPDNQAEKEVRGSLAPARWIEGTVTYGDTGQPVANAPVVVNAMASEMSSRFATPGKTDGQGHFRINPTEGNLFEIQAYPAPGTPYLARKKAYEWRKGTIRLEAKVALPRGALVVGTITEAGTGKPVPRAAAQFLPRGRGNPYYRDDVEYGWNAIVLSDAAGVFRLAVLPGPCTLLIHADEKYILEESADAKIETDRAGGHRMYASRFVSLQTKPGSTVELPITLRRGVAIRGKLEGPHGEPVSKALMIHRYQSSPFQVYAWWSGPSRIEDGLFACKGCEVGKTYTIYFLDPEHRWGRTLSVTAGNEGTEVGTVRLEPCGSAEARGVDSEGKPVRHWHPGFSLLVTPGLPDYDPAVRQGKFAADEGFVENIDRRNHPMGSQGDEQGRMTWPALIPGATYRLQVSAKELKEFTVQPGQTVDLGVCVTGKH